jgi:hypothetical protein
MVVGSSALLTEAAARRPLSVSMRRTRLTASDSLRPRQRWEEWGGAMSTHKSTAQGSATAATLPDHDSAARFVELFKLRTLAASTQAQSPLYP